MYWVRKAHVRSLETCWDFIAQQWVNRLSAISVHSHAVQCGNAQYMEALQHLYAGLLQAANTAILPQSKEAWWRFARRAAKGGYQATGEGEGAGKPAATIAEPSYLVNRG